MLINESSIGRMYILQNDIIIHLFEDIIDRHMNLLLTKNFDTEM